MKGLHVLIYMLGGRAGVIPTTTYGICLDVAIATVDAPCEIAYTRYAKIVISVHWRWLSW